jgi:hypothetical protein
VCILRCGPPAGIQNYFARSTAADEKDFCGAHSEPKLYYHTRWNASQDAISDIICRAFLRMHVYFALQSMLRRRMPSGHTASQKTQHRAQLPALFYCGARAIKCVYEANWIYTWSPLSHVIFMSKYTSYPASLSICELIYNQILLQLIVIAVEKGCVLFCLMAKCF